MTSLQQDIDVADRLRLALENGSIPSQYHQLGTRLLSHLRKPLQVAIIGLPGSGKSSLISMLLGRKEMPALAGVDIVEFAHGAELRTTVEYPDGVVENHQGLLSDKDLRAGALRARIEMAEPALLNQTCVEIRLTGAPRHQETLLRHAIQSSEILVYCSEAFGVPEQNLWSRVPDEIKDHSFLALTMADRQIMKGTLNARLGELERVASEEFLGLYPIAALQAILARSEGAPAGGDLWTSSGGKDLTEALAHQIERGRTEDLDKADMLLEQFAADLATKTNPLNDGKTPAPIKNEPDQAASSGQPAQSAGASEADASIVLQQMLDQLQTCADEMLAEVPEQGEPDPSQVLEQCVKAINDLSSNLEHAECSDPVITELLEDAREGEEMMLLLQLEKGEDAATDAVVLMMQLKKQIFKRGCV